MKQGSIVSVVFEAGTQRPQFLSLNHSQRCSWPPRRVEPKADSRLWGAAGTEAVESLQMPLRKQQQHTPSPLLYQFGLCSFCKANSLGWTPWDSNLIQTCSVPAECTGRTGASQTSQQEAAGGSSSEQCCSGCRKANVLYFIFSSRPESNSDHHHPFLQHPT